MTKKEREKRNDNIIDLWIRGNELNWIAFTHNLHKNRVKAVIRKFIEEYERWREEKRNENTPRISAPDKRNARGDIRKTKE